MTYQKIKTYYEKKKYKKCYKLENKLISLTSTEADVYPKLIIQHGKTLFSLKRFHDAIKYFKISLSTLKDDALIYQVNTYLFKTYYEISDYENIIKYGLATCEYQNIDILEKANILAIVGRFYYLQHLSSNKKVYLIRGLFYNTESQKLFNQTKQTNTENYFYTLYDCADINFGLEDYDTAQKLYEKLEKMTNDNDLLLGIYTNLAYIYKEKGYFDTNLFYERKIKLLN